MIAGTGNDNGTDTGRHLAEKLFHALKHRCIDGIPFFRTGETQNCQVAFVPLVDQGRREINLSIACH
jgi:hypothetical protein